MKLLRMWYQPIAEVEFTWAEVESLALLSERHYDHKCRELGKEGGVLHGMRNMFEAKGKGAVIVYRLDGYAADMLAKTAEADPALLLRLTNVSRQINGEWRKVNKENL